ncbi:MAG: META domain-containing protein [Capsulimonadales bacterium]|nr:META domain-containing protein [Capsulimonadales bacterium]
MFSRFGALLALTLLSGSASGVRAQGIQGDWQVCSITTTITKTRSQGLDGISVKTFKGPIVGMTLRIDRTTYTETGATGSRTYSLRKAGSGYRLRRQEGSETITILLSDIRRTPTELRFTSIRRNEKRQEQTVVRWNCRPLVASKTTAALAGVTWELVEILYNDDRTVRPAGETMRVTFGPGERLTGKAGNNRFTGSFRTGSDRSLKIGPLAATRMADPPDSIAATFLKDLESANRYLFEKEDLILQLPIDTGILKFRKVVP